MSIWFKTQENKTNKKVNRNVTMNTELRCAFVIGRLLEDRLDVIGVCDDDSDGGSGDVGGRAVVADPNPQVVFSRHAGIVPVLLLQQRDLPTHLRYFQCCRPCTCKVLS